MKKRIIAVLVIVVIVVAGAMYYLLGNMDSIVAAAIEKYGSEVTSTPVSVSGVHVSLREGRISVEDLRVANPKESGGGDALTLNDITGRIDYGSVRHNPVVIDEIHILAPTVYAKFSADGTSNIQVLRDRIESHNAGSTRSEKKTKDFRIKTFALRQGKVELDATALGVEKREIVLPEIGLADVGGTQGAPPDEIAKAILGAITRRAAAEIARSEVEGLIRNQLKKNLPDKAKGLLEKLNK